MAELTTRSRSSRQLTWAIGLMALVMSIASVYQVHHYGETRPTVADLTSGHTHAVKIHQKVVYLTAGEFGAAVTSHVMAIAAIGIFLGLLLRARAKRSGQDQPS
ncbi:MAG TPA: hypothetical protein VJS37_08200 [Terriglobales bacterium]|nr:hypothetical protein [Terriglobales bacterium]